MRPRWKKMILFAPLAILGILLFIAIGGGVVRWLWNWLLPPLFDWPAITFWQALALLALCRILFGGWHSSGRSSRRGITDRIAERVAERMGERWDAMTPEEREQFRQRIRERCGAGPSTGESKEQ